MGENSDETLGRCVEGKLDMDWGIDVLFNFQLYERGH